MHKFALVLLFGSLFLHAQVPAAAPVSPGLYVSGPQVVAFFSDVDDSDQPYALYIPKHFDPSHKYPLVVSLHGAWSNHRLNLRRVFGQGNQIGESDVEATRRFPALPDVDFFVASPLARGTMGYQGLPEKDVLDVLADVKRRFPIDEDRIYLTGLSMGGGGTLWLGLTHPDIWAAIAPVCASVPPGTEELAPNAANLPVKLFHGDRDPSVPVSSSRDWHQRLADLGVNVEYIEYPGVRHNAWNYAYKDASIFQWFNQFRRDRFPDRVRFATRDYQHGGAYWVRFDELAPGELAEIDARFTGTNRLEIRTSQLDGFTLRLAGHPKFSGRQTVSVTIDGETIRLRAHPELSFARRDQSWKPGLYERAAGEKAPGTEGPIAAAVSARHIYVYGTADEPGPGELARRRNEANQAAEWSVPGMRLTLSLRVLADKDVKPFDLESSNLILFGTRETNSLVARFASQLPVQLNAGAADFGLLAVAPAGGHYIVVSSGLPWWTHAGAAQRRGLPYIAAPYRLLLSFGDYILFQGGLDHVIAEGRCDRNWNVPAAGVQKMMATGAVQVR